MFYLFKCSSKLSLQLTSSKQSSKPFLKQNYSNIFFDKCLQACSPNDSIQNLSSTNFSKHFLQTIPSNNFLRKIPSNIFFKSCLQQVPSNRFSKTKNKTISTLSRGVGGIEIWNLKSEIPDFRLQISANAYTRAKKNISTNTICSRFRNRNPLGAAQMYMRLKCWRTPRADIKWKPERTI